MKVKELRKRKDYDLMLTQFLIKYLYCIPIIYLTLFILICCMKEFAKKNRFKEKW